MHLVCAPNVSYEVTHCCYFFTIIRRFAFFFIFSRIGWILVLDLDPSGGSLSDLLFSNQLHNNIYIYKGTQRLENDRFVNIHVKIWCTFYINIRLSYRFIRNCCITRSVSFLRCWGGNQFFSWPKQHHR